MNLKTRFLLLTGIFIALTATVLVMAFSWVAEDLVERWGRRLAEKQVLYDKARTLQPLMREIALARQMAESGPIRAWLRDPGNAALAKPALAEMESYRRNFRDRNYFLAARATGRYYFNNADNEFAGKEFRYTLSQSNPDDAWFYALLRGNRDMHININPDTKLNVVKLWIDVLIRDGNQVLGVVGTGLDLRRFIHEVVDVPQTGITSLFVDHNAAIQLYHDPRFIDYASLVKSAQERKSLDLVLDRPEDRQAIRAMMAGLVSGGDPVVSRFVQIQGKRYLAGIAYLPEIDWHEITLMDLDVLVPKKDFLGLVLAFLATLFVALLLFNMVINRILLRPLAVLDNAMSKVQEDKPLDLPSTGVVSEIARLFGHFQRMARAVHEERENLEHLVAERTKTLDRLTRLDPLTELLNRRGMRAALEHEMSRAQRLGHRFGVIWLDVDRFKEINDTLGHAVGDLALLAISDRIRRTIRQYDTAARWGGDEFIILLPETDIERLGTFCERLRARVAEIRHLGDVEMVDIPLSVSVGAYLCHPGEPLDSILHMADKALYAAKVGGRNRISVLHSEQAEPSAGS